MRRRLLRRIAETVFRNAGISFVVLALLTTLAIFGIRHLRLDTGLSDFLPPSLPSARIVSDTLQDYRNLEPIVVRFSPGEKSDPAIAQLDLISAADSFAETLGYSSYITRPVYRVDSLAQKYYESLSDFRLMAVLTDRDWAYLRNLEQASISLQRLMMIRARRLSLLLPSHARQSDDDPLGVLASIRNRISLTRAPIPINPQRGYFFSPDGEDLLMLLYPVRPAEDGLYAWDTLKFIESVRGVVLDQEDRAELVNITFSGSHVTTAENLRLLAIQLLAISIGSILVVLFLLTMVFHKVEVIAFVVIPPVLGLIWTLGLGYGWSRMTQTNLEVDIATGRVYAHVTGVTIAFLLVAFGIGINYSMHLFHRFTYELYRTRNYYRALQVSYVETGRAVMASALISAMLFYLVYLTSFRGLREMGVMAGTAVLCNLAATMLVVPTLAALKHWLARGKVSPISIYNISIARFSEPAIRNPRVTLGAILLITIVLGIRVTPHGLDLAQMRFHPRFTSIAAYFFRSESGMHLGKEKAEAPPVGPGRPLVAVVESESFEGVLEANDKLYDSLLSALERHGDSLGILAIDSLRVIQPSEKTQRESIEKLKGLDLAAVKEALAIASWREGFQPAVFQPFLDSLDRMKKGVEALQPQDYRIQFDAIHGEEYVRAVQRLAKHDEDAYRVATPIYPGSNGFSRKQLRLLYDAIDPEGGQIRIIGDSVVEDELSHRIRFDLALLVTLGAIAICAGLMLHFKGLRPMTLAVAPVVMQALWLSGAMAMFDIPLHMLSLMAMALVLILSVDNSIHLYQRFRDRQPADVRRSIVTAGQAVSLSCCLTGLTFGALFLTTFEGLRDLGMVALLGSLFNLVVILLFLPALIRIWGRDQPLINILRSSDDERL